MSAFAPLALETAWLSVLACGLLAGLQLGTAMAGYSARDLPEMSWTLRQQAEDQLFRRVMPLFLTVTCLLLVGATLLARGASRSWFAAAAVLCAANLVLAVSRQRSLNREIGDWIPGDAPEAWMALRDKWVVLHSLRSAVAIVSFGCASAGLIRFALDAVRR